MSRFVVAADIGGTKIAVARVSDAGTLTDLCEAPTPSEGGWAVLDPLITLLRKVLRKDEQAIAVDVPGLAYRDGSVWAPNIKDWKKFPVREELQREFGLPVIVESDRNAFIMGEAWKGAARGQKNAIFVVVGTGIGAGILADGRLIRGEGEVAGSVGWMAVRDEFLPSYASTGCLEALAAGPAIEGLGRKRLGNGRRTCEQIVQQAFEGNEIAKGILYDAGRSLGLGLANLVSMFNPAVIVIGGGVSEAGDYVLLPAVEAMKKWAQPIAVKQVRILRSQLGKSAGLLGVAKLAFDEADKGEANSNARGHRRKLAKTL